MNHIIGYFVDRPRVANVTMFALIGVAFLCWQQIGKEEMPEFAMEWVRISIRYPGATAHDVERSIVKPVEEKIKGISGLEEVSATSSYGSASFSISFEPRLPHLSEKIQEIKDAIGSIRFPSDVEEATFRQFRSSEKAIIDIGLYLEGVETLSIPNRMKLQEFALAFKNKLLSEPSVSGIDSTGYLVPELQIKILPDKLKDFELSLDEVRRQILAKNFYRSLGNLKDQNESAVTITSSLEDPETLKEVIVSSGFSGNTINLGQVADIAHGFETTQTLTKIQGHEGLLFNVKKSSSIDILSAQKEILEFVKKFEKATEKTNLRFVIIDDESYDIRNRLSLIGRNGVIGFLLILFVLFMFLDLRTGLWVAMGIPFALAFTLIFSLWFGYTVNNMTLAALIIVLGIVVDDAIIVAENISRRREGQDPHFALNGTREVISPIIASILTTCAAFVPLYFFSGRFGLLVKYIPAIIFLMLFASLLESLCILPSHMRHQSKLSRWLASHPLSVKLGSLRSWMLDRLEDGFARALQGVLNVRALVLLLFVAGLFSAFHIFTSQMKYVMFPREEVRNFRLKVVAQEGTNRHDMAHKVRPVEDIVLASPVVTSVRTSIGQSRRGGQVNEHEASIQVELLPPSERRESFKVLISKWTKQFDELTGFEEIKVQRSWFGSDSGSPIVIEVQENNDDIRDKIVQSLKTKLASLPSLINIEVERPLAKPEFTLEIKREKASRLGVNFSELASVLKAYVEGDILYKFNSDEEEVRVRLTANKANQNDLRSLLKATVANRNNYLIPIGTLVTVREGKKPVNINRINYKRTTNIYADLAPASGRTPLEVAKEIERDIFPVVQGLAPSVNMIFRGEVEESRESQGDFLLSIILVLAIIFVLLVFLFNSFAKPMLIAAIIPFGIIGTILAFWGHGLVQYGFFAVVGCLGMIGVVINDSIVLIDRYSSLIDRRFENTADLFAEVARVTSSRLRAVVVTTLTTIAGLFPTAYGIGGYDSMLAEMMLAMGWGLLFGMPVTLILVPALYSYYLQVEVKMGGSI